MRRINRIIVKPMIHMLMNKVNEETTKKIADDLLIGNQIFSVDGVIHKIDYCSSYRNILYWRFLNDIGNKKWSRLLINIIKTIYKPLDSVEIYVASGELGGGFYIPHNYCVVNAERIGENVTITQGVTIGKGTDGKKPSIGNNVKIFPNAVIAGGITIGNNVYIGANAYVNYDVPDNSTVRAPKSSYSDYKKINNSLLC